MKFGKRIQGEAVEAWAPYYFDYKQLKKQLKQIVGKGAPEADERDFKKAIIAEIDKVGTFFAQQESELYSEFRALCAKVTETQLDDPVVVAKAQNAKGTSGQYNLEKLVEVPLFLREQQ
jgi:SPX domain protein involved in polyphosphate accumulation